MPSRKLDELSTEVDDASLIVEELQIAPDKDTPGKLDELGKNFGVDLSAHQPETKIRDLTF